MGDPVPPMFWFRDPDGNTLMIVEQSLSAAIAGDRLGSSSRSEPVAGASAHQGRLGNLGDGPIRSFACDA